MASKLEGAMGGLIAVFYQYSGKDGDKTKLSLDEFKTLSQKEIGICPTDSKDPTVGKLMKGLDQNKDGQMEFNEYAVLVASLALACDSHKKPCDKSAEKSCSNLHKAMRDISEVFYQYSGKEGDKNKLNKSEVKALLQAEFAALLGAKADQKQVDDFMKALDHDGDGEVNFTEYITLVASLTMLINEFFTEKK